MSDTYKLEDAQAFSGVSTVITHQEKDGDKHEIVIIAADNYSLATFLRETMVVAKPNESKFQRITLIKP